LHARFSRRASRAGGGPAEARQRLSTLFAVLHHEFVRCSPYCTVNVRRGAQAADLLKHASESPVVRMNSVTVPLLLGTYNQASSIHLVQQVAVVCNLSQVRWVILMQ
jgi:hypothetical protein